MDTLRWTFFVDGMPFDGAAPEQKSLGGSETAGLLLARALAARGHDVHLFCRTDKEAVHDGVRYHGIQHYVEWTTNVPHDIAVVQRVPHPLTLPIAAPVRFLWVHDLALKRTADPMRGILWAVDRVMVLSEFMKRQYQTVYGLPDSALHVTRNGIDLRMLEAAPGPDGPRDMKALIFTARPERGMDILLEDTFPRLLREDPELRLYLAGYSNYPDFLRPLYDKCQRLIDRYAGRARHLGSLPKRDLYKLYKTGALYVYPTDFEEISCITAMECMAAGLPIVASDLAALTETVAPGAGVLVGHPAEPGKALEAAAGRTPIAQADGSWRIPGVEQFDPHKGARHAGYQEAFVRACLRLLRDQEVWAAASKAGQEAAKALDWDGVAAEWEALGRSLLAEETAKELAHV